MTTSSAGCYAARVFEKLKNCDELKNDSETYRYLLRFGCADITEIIDWADSIIKSKDEPPVEVIELSLMSNNSLPDIDLKPGEIKGEVNRIQVRDRLINRVRTKVKLCEIGKREAANRLYRFALMDEDIWGDLYADVLWLDDAFDLAYGGHFGTMVEAEENLMEFLERGSS